MDQRPYSSAELPATSARPDPDFQAAGQRGQQDFWRPIEAELGLPPGFLEIDEHRRRPSGASQTTADPPYRPGMYADRWPAPGGAADYRRQWWYEHRERTEQPSDYNHPGAFRHSRRSSGPSEQWDQRPGCYDRQCLPQNPDLYRNQWQWQHQGRYNQPGNPRNNSGYYRDQWQWQHQGRYNQPGDPRDNSGYYRDQWQWQHQGRYNQPGDPRNNSNYYRDQWQWQHRDQRYDRRPDNRPEQYDPHHDRQTREGFENRNWQLLAPVLRQLQGQSVSQFDRSVPDNLGCARAVSLALEGAYGLPIREQAVQRLEDTITRYGWVRVAPEQALPGDVIIGHRGAGQKGHAAIYIGNDQIFNNDSGARRMQIDSLNKFRSREFATVAFYRKAR